MILELLIGEYEDELGSDMNWWVFLLWMVCGGGGIFDFVGGSWYVCDVECVDGVV